MVLTFFLNLILYGYTEYVIEIKHFDIYIRRLTVAQIYINALVVIRYRDYSNSSFAGICMVDAAITQVRMGATKFPGCSTTLNETMNG